MKEHTVSITWGVDDIKCLKPNWTDEQCIDFLEEIEDNLRDRSIEFGWECINILLSENENES